MYDAYTLSLLKREYDNVGEILHAPALMTTIMRGIWSSEELKFAKSKCYEITVIKGYQINKA